MPEAPKMLKHILMGYDSGTVGLSGLKLKPNLEIREAALASDALLTSESAENGLIPSDLCLGMSSLNVI